MPKHPKTYPEEIIVLQIVRKKAPTSVEKGTKLKSNQIREEEGIIIMEN